MAHGGARKGAGRKSKVEEDKVTEIFLSALKGVYNTNEDFETKVEFVKDLQGTQRGQIFIAEHLFGKPKEIIQHETDDNTIPIIKFFKTPNESK